MRLSLLPDSLKGLEHPEGSGNEKISANDDRNGGEKDGLVKRQESEDLISAWRNKEDGLIFLGPDRHVIFRALGFQDHGLCSITRITSLPTPFSIKESFLAKPYERSTSRPAI